MFVVSNPELIEMIRVGRRWNETPEQYLLRQLKHARSLQISIDEMTKKINELWPIP